MKKTLLLFAALLALCLPVSAQSQGDPPRAAPVEKKSEPETFSASHLKAAEELLDSVQMESSLNGIMEEILQSQIASDPKKARLEPVIRKFFKKYMSFEALKPDFIRLYASNFTESELKELAAFYRTDVGKKAITKMPLLFAQGGEIGKKKVLEHLPELIQMIRELDGKGDGKAEGN